MVTTLLPQSVAFERVIQNVCCTLEAATEKTRRLNRLLPMIVGIGISFIFRQYDWESWL